MLNYLKNVLAKIDAARAGAEEASPRDRALEGVTRGAILSLAAEAGLEAHEARLTRFDVYTAAERCLTGTGAEVRPVVEVDGRRIGDGAPGPITRRLQEA